MNQTRLAYEKKHTQKLNKNKFKKSKQNKNISAFPFREKIVTSTKNMGDDS